jgi:hypothetical protein
MPEGDVREGGTCIRLGIIGEPSDSEYAREASLGIGRGEVRIQGVAGACARRSRAAAVS